MKAKTPEDIEKLDWKKAKGITERGKRGTNSMLEERDYEVDCDITGDPLMVVHGIHIWWCKSHHQPENYCCMARTKIKTLAFAEAVKRNDKTEPYEYGGYRHMEEAKNADGESPGQFKRWLTPKEMALDFIKDLNQ